MRKQFPRVEKGQYGYPTGQFNKLLGQVEYNSRLKGSGDVTVTHTEANPIVSADETNKTVIMELTGDMTAPYPGTTHPAPTVEVPSPRETYVPYASARQVFLDHAVNPSPPYKIIHPSESNDVTVWFPTLYQDADEVMIGYKPWHIYDRIWARFSEQTGRWEAIIQTPEIGFWGKAYEDIDNGSSGTVTLWASATGDWAEWSHTSTKVITAFAPPLMTSGTISSGKWVFVGKVNKRWVIRLAECE